MSAVSPNAPTAAEATKTGGVAKQHLIDPEICIRCNTCEETCPIDAITHNDDNYVVDASICNFCMACISPCPTGAIDNWRVVRAPYSLDDQFGWDELPEQVEVAAEPAAPGEGDTADAEGVDEAIARLLAEAHAGVGGRTRAPASAAKPEVNLYKAGHPAIATVVGNYRLTAPDAETDIRHIILDLGSQRFPVLEGQSVGIVAPGTDRDGKPHAPRLYSLSSPRDGERAGVNNIALTVKREPHGVCSNYVCDLAKGDQVRLTGPFGATFLMPDDPAAHIIMICTGTGSAPFRGFTMRRQRTRSEGPGHLHLYFGARRPEELPYFGPLKKVPPALMTQHLCYSRVAGQAKEYVQDRMRSQAETLLPLLSDDRTHIYVCGLKGMETGVDEALADICRRGGVNWAERKAALRESGRYHVETY